MKENLEIYIDGACRGNPGPAAVGVVIFGCRKGEAERRKIKEISQGIGHATNNIAEYWALIYALQEALALKVQYIKIFTDSELLYNQILGQYKVKNERLKPLYDQIKYITNNIGEVKMMLIPREENKEADKLATSALKTIQRNVNKKIEVWKAD